jgi:hypothetical protein
LAEGVGSVNALRQGVAKRMGTQDHAGALLLMRSHDLPLVAKRLVYHALVVV